MAEDDINFQSSVNDIEVEPAIAARTARATGRPVPTVDQLLAANMTPEAYYSKLQKASLWQGALGNAVPAIVDAASLIVKPYELTQAENALKKQQATEKGIPLDVQQARIDSAVGRTQQTVNAQLRVVSDQLAMNPPPAKRNQLMAQQRKLTAQIGVAETQVSASVGAQSAEIAQQQVGQQQQLEQGIARALRQRRQDLTGGVIKGVSAALDVAAAARQPPDYGTFLAESKQKATTKGSKYGAELASLQADETALKASLATDAAAGKKASAAVWDSTMKAADRVSPSIKDVEKESDLTPDQLAAGKEMVDMWEKSQDVDTQIATQAQEGQDKLGALSAKIDVFKTKRAEQQKIAGAYEQKGQEYQTQMANAPAFPTNPYLYGGGTPQGLVGQPAQQLGGYAGPLFDINGRQIR